jgi:hypothetical protein
MLLTSKNPTYDKKHKKMSRNCKIRPEQRHEVGWERPVLGVVLGQKMDFHPKAAFIALYEGPGTMIPQPSSPKFEKGRVRGKTFSHMWELLQV